jgi:hypothetical protein
MPGSRICIMLDGDRYFRAFPDESPPQHPALSSAELVAALAALQREFQQILARAEPREAARSDRAG